MKKVLIILLLGLSFPLYGQYKIVILGSSSAAGNGASPSDSAWVNRYTAYLAANYPSFSITNLAYPGFTTADVLPTGNATYNITKALTYSPNAIIIHLPTNDTYNGVSVATQLANYRTIVNTARAANANIKIWIGTPQPRDYLNSTQIQMQRDMIDSVNAVYGAYAIDFWTTLALSNGDIDPTYGGQTDGIHLNNAGHRIIYQRVVAENIPSIVLNNPNIYYVSNSGNNSNNGTSTSTPWQTLSKVNSATLNPGDRVLFKKGDTFYGFFTVSNSGTSGNPIIYGAYGSGANPIITGFTTVSTWTNQGGNIWQSTNSVSSLTNCNIVTINGLVVPMGRLPKSTATWGGFYSIASHVNGTSITTTSLTGTPNWTGAEVVVRPNSWTLARANITAQSGGTLTISPAIATPIDGNGFFIQNDIRCCTQQNDWYYNPSTGKLNIYSTSQPSNVNIASIENLITINANYITIDGISFTGANGSAVYGDNSKNHISIINCNADKIGICGFYSNDNYLLIDNNNMTDINCTGIGCAYGDNVTLTNNYLHNVGIFPGMRRMSLAAVAYGAIDIEEAGNISVKYNNIVNTGFNGISFYATTSLFQYNFVDTFCTVLDDGAGIYTYAGTGRTNMTSALVTNNIFINGIGAPNGIGYRSGAAGIYYDEQSRRIETSYNFVANTYMYGVQLNLPLGDMNFHHNTIYNGSQHQYFDSYWGGYSMPSNDLINHNIFIAKSSDQYSFSFEFDSYTPYTSKQVFLNSHTLDYNYYARPISQTNIIHTLLDGDYNLANWKTYSGQDAHSSGPSQTITSENDFYVYYNSTKTATTTSLSQPMIDIPGNRYVGNITLQPYTGVVLMRDTGAQPSKKKALMSNKRIVRYLGKTLMN